MFFLAGKTRAAIGGHIPPWLLSHLAIFKLCSNSAASQNSRLPISNGSPVETACHSANVCAKNTTGHSHSIQCQYIVAPRTCCQGPVVKGLLLRSCPTVRSVCGGVRMNISSCLGLDFHGAWSFVR